MIDFFVVFGICAIAIVAMAAVSLRSKCECGGDRPIGQFNNKELMDKLAEEAKKGR